jgi:hypothetical protein
MKGEKKSAPGYVSQDLRGKREERKKEVLAEKMASRGGRGEGEREKIFRKGR